MARLKLYNYFRSSASYRARIALHWKGLPFDYIPVHLVKNGGEQNDEKYRKLNPMGHVPTLIDGDFAIAETVAIFEYLDRVFPEKPLFPADPKLHAKTLQLCEIINSGIQPYQNLKVTKDFETARGWTAAQTEAWVQHYIEAGLHNLEKVLEGCAGTHAVGGEVTAAEAFIIPQCFSSRRFKVKIENYPILARIEKAALGLEPFKKAHPEAQPDYQK